MQVKKFEAPTMAEALNLVKAELGPEAIILSTKNHRKGFGLLSKASVEVTAAVADKSLVKKQTTEKVVPSATKEQIGKLSASEPSEIYDEFTGYYQRKKEERSQNGQQSYRHSVPVSSGGGTFAATAQSSSPRSAQARDAGKVSTPPRYIDIDDEDDDMPQQSGKGYGRNGRVQQAVAHADAEAQRQERPSSQGRMGSSPQGASAQQAPQRSAPAPQQRVQTQSQNQYQQQYQYQSQGPSGGGMDLIREDGETFQAGAVNGLQEDIQRLKAMMEEIKSEQQTLADSRIPETTSDELQVEFNNLLRNGIDKRFATPLIKQVSFALSREALASSDKIVEALAVEMMNNVKIDNPLDFKPGSERRVFALVGPTGVGKTTTIAKLASQAILQRNLRVGLINVDSYKVAALDQLATYAKILNVPFRQASNAMELDRALQEFKPLDLVLIDTSGRSQRDSESLSQMKTLLSENTAVRPILIMSATTRDQELYDIITRFKIFNPTGLVFSKLDESATFGCIYNVSVKTGLPLTYFTVGQRVPEDLEAASRERVADLILDI